MIAATCAQDSRAICVITRINVTKKKVFIVIFNSMMVLEEYAEVCKICSLPGTKNVLTIQIINQIIR